MANLKETTMNYSETFKMQTASRLKNERLCHVSRELGISVSTLKSWRTKYAHIANCEALESSSAGFDRSMRFLTVVETFSMTEARLAEYAESKGLTPEQIKEWKSEFMAPETAKDAEISALKKCLDEEAARHRKEIGRKDSVIAELTAIAVMLKKAKAIWGVKEEE